MKDDTKKKKITKEALSIAAKEIILPRWRILLLGLILILLSRVAGLVLPGSFKYLVDNVFTGKNRELLTYILLAVVAAGVIQAVCNFLLTRILQVEAHNLISRLRVKVARHILHLPLELFNKEKVGALVSRIMIDPEGVRNLVGTGFVELIGGTLTAGLSLFFLFRINTPMTLFSLVILLVFGGIMLKAFAIIRPIFRKRGEINADVTGRLNETIGGIRVIKGFHAEKRESKIFAEGAGRLYNNVKKSLTATALVTMFGLILISVTSAGVMWFSSFSVIKGDMTTGDFMSYLMFLALLAMPIIQMSNIGSQITESFAGLDRMNEMLGLVPEGSEPERSHVLSGIRGKIEFKNVSFEYKEDVPVIRGINFEVTPGMVTALVGSSGSGKSTIASLVASFYKPDGGEVLVDGINLNTIKLDSYRKHLAVVLQDDFLFEGTIRENILFGKPHATETELNKALDIAFVTEFASKMPEGINTLIGERGVRLSGGQKQRLSIARAIIADPKILILDEATSNLDTESEKLIQEALGHLIKGRTTFIIAHRLSTIRQADQILVIEDGKIGEQGTHEDLIARQGRYYQLYTYQARI
ncbi:MAG: ABC transporter ATP-binding protein [Spirochaetales bacterium]|nr:ABC transporter ATP-binding protein [Spirochaetales bacterium]